MKKNTTKRSLALSVLSLVLCVAMLLGTTFAWFTDSVTSGVNQIVAGNLDIEVKYSKNGSDWADLQDSHSLFTGALWEPGHTEVVYLRVENKGTLALRYKYAVNAIAETIGTTKDGEQIKLSNILKFGIVKTDNFQSYTRDSARAAVDGNVLALNTYTNDIHMEVGGKAFFAMLVYMPEEVGNEANYLTGTTPPSIDLGINVVATQDTVETDSFDHNYDVNAYQAAGYTVTAVVPVETVSKAIPTTVAGSNETVREATTIVAGGITATYPAGALMTNSSTKADGNSSEDAKQGLVPKDTAPEHYVSVAEGETAKAYELTLPVSQDNNVLVKFVKNIGANKTITNVYHNGTALTLLPAGSTTPESDGVKEYYDYSSATGDLTLWVYHASEITTTEKDGAPVEHMFPDVNVTIMSEVAAGSEIVMTDAASGTKAIIPGNAIDEGIVKVGQKIYVVIITTKQGEDSATYDISVRDADGKPLNWTLNCMPEVTFCLGKQDDLIGFHTEQNFVEAGFINLYDRVGAIKYPEETYGGILYDNHGSKGYGHLMYGLPAGENYRPGVVYNPETGFITIRSLTFE